MEKVILKIIHCILSESLKQNLLATPPKLSVLQWATIAAENMERSKLSKVFQELSKVSRDVYEQKLLLAAVSDLQKGGDIGDQAQKVFDEMQKGDLPPYFPFLEICHLPILFQCGDVIVDRCTGAVACVESVSQLTANSDFTDECYYCHSLDQDITEQALRDGYGHLHIHLCDADYYELNILTTAQKKNLNIIRVFLTDS